MVKRRCSYHGDARHPRGPGGGQRCRRRATHYAVFPDAEYVDICGLHARAIAKIYDGASSIFRLEVA